MNMYTNTTTNHVVLLKKIGHASPTPMHTTSKATPMIVLTKRLGDFLLNSPKAIASGINNVEATATEPFAATCCPSALKPAKVPATMSAKAATTSIRTSHAKTVKQTLVLWLILASIISPKDLPL